MNIFRNTKWTIKARKEEITRAKRHNLRLHLERLDRRVQASSSILGAVWGMLIADAFGRDSEENRLALSNLLQDDAAKIASESSIAAQVAAPDIQPKHVTPSQPTDSVPTQRALKQTATTELPLSDQSAHLGENAASLASSLKLLDDGVPLLEATQDPPTAAEVDVAMTPPSNAGGAGSSGGAGMPRVGNVVDAPAGAAFSATAPAVPGASGGGGPSVTLSDDVPEVQGSAEGENTLATDSAFLATGSGTDAAEDETLLESDAGTADSGTMSFTGCGCGTAPCVTRENWCPMCGGSHDENLLSEVFLDYYDDNSYYDNNAHNDNATTIRLPHFFADNEQAACTLGYAVQSNSDPSLVDANISTNCAGIPFLDLQALDSPGVADVIVRGADGDGMYADWGIKVYAVEVTGFIVQERAWAEAQWNGPEDSDQCGASDATWNVLWGADSHRWTPTVAPPEAHDRVVMHGFMNENGEFANANWCNAPPSADYSNWDRWAYGTPNAQGETAINPLVTFSALDEDALLSDNAYVRIKTDPEPDHAPRISLHTISAEYHDGLEWEPVSPAETKEVPALCQDLSFAELADTTDRPYWAVFPTTGTVDYDVVEVKVRISPAIPDGMEGDVHLAWYDPVNTIANVPSTPPTTTTANTVRDNHQDAELTPLTGTTVTFEEDMDEESAYYRINTPRFGDNYIVAAHPHNGFETGYYFDGCGCGCGSTEEFLHYDDYPEGTNCGVNPGHPDFTAPLVDALLTGNKQTPTLNILPSVDLDTDSDNNGTIDYSELEEAIEDKQDKPGKRIFHNVDDDNKNGIPDIKDTAIDHGLPDNDFARISLAFDGEIPEGYELWLGYQHAGLKLYLDRMKTTLFDIAALAPDNVSGEEIEVEDDKWFYWKDGSVGTDIPSVVYAEGISEDNYKVYWRLVEAGTGGVNVISRDTVRINVEEIVWPNSDSAATWDSTEPTSEWDGFTFDPGWYVSKSLSDIINGGVGDGYFRTEYPRKTSSGGPLDWWEGENGDTDYGHEEDHDSLATFDVKHLFGTADWTDETVTIEFDYSFEDAPHTIGHYVDVNRPDLYKPGFFANSGVYFDNKAEIQIYDTASLVDAIDNGRDVKIDGQTVTVSAVHTDDEDTPWSEINSSGYVQLTHPTEQKAWVAEAVTTLISGRPYGVALPGDATATNKQLLTQAPGSGSMEIHATRANDGTDYTYTFSVWVNGSPVADKVNVTNGTGGEGPSRAPTEAVHLQSHWASGVVFENVKVRK